MNRGSTCDIEYGGKVLIEVLVFGVFDGMRVLDGAGGFCM